MELDINGDKVLVPLLSKREQIISCNRTAAGSYKTITIYGQGNAYFNMFLLLFRSSTLLKKVTVPKRHLDSFAGYEYTLGAKRGVILHTDRYQVSRVANSIVMHLISVGIKIDAGVTQRLKKSLISD